MPRRESGAVFTLAVKYAADELGFDKPRVYGSQVDPQVPGTRAIWVQEEYGRGSIGLIVNTELGVLDEFDPEEHGPGTLRQKAEADLLDYTIEVTR